MALIKKPIHELLKIFAIIMIVMIVVITSMISGYFSRHCKKCSEISPNRPQIDSITIQQIEYDSLSVLITVYNPTKAQCDGSPLITADGSKIDINNPQRWCAISKDLLLTYSYGDTILIDIPQAPYLNGLWIIHDTGGFHGRKNSIDLLIANPIVARIEGCWKGSIITTKE